MYDRLLFLQALAKWMEREHINVFSTYLPPLDRDFWGGILRFQESKDRRVLEQIAASLRKNTSDFRCIEEIKFLVSTRGFDTSPRHDFG